MHDFDPYSFIMQLEKRITRLEHAHNNLSEAFMKTDNELSQALSMLQSLQKHHLTLRHEFDRITIEKARERR